MFDLILISHGSFAAGMREAAEFIMGEQEGLAVLGLYPGETVDYFAGKLEKAIDSFPDPKNVLILSDLPNGTPSNAAMLMVLKKGVSCISGCNLPLVLEILGARDEVDIQQAVVLACEIGKKSIVSSDEIIARNKAKRGEQA